MPNWIDQQVQKQHFWRRAAAMLPHAKTPRSTLLLVAIVNLALTVGLKRMRFYSPMLAQLGRRLEAYGDRLQMRYSAALDVASPRIRAALRHAAEIFSGALPSGAMIARCAIRQRCAYAASAQVAALALVRHTSSILTTRSLIAYGFTERLLIVLLLPHWQAGHRPSHGW